MKKAAEKLWLGAVVVVMICSTSIYLAPHFDWRVSTVLSASMQPSLPTGSLLITRPVSPDTIVVGDIITFQPKSVDGLPETHRVVGIETHSGLRFLTKGDANIDLDNFRVPQRNLLGLVVFNTPHWGYFSEFLKTPWGFALGLVLPGIIVGIAYSISVAGAFDRKDESPEGVPE